MSFVDADAALSSLRVALEALSDPGRARVGTEVDPRAVDLDRAAGVAGQRPPCGRRRSPEKLLPHVTMSTASSSRKGATTSMRTARSTHRCSGAPQSVSRDVVDRRVLEVARDGVEAQPTGRVRVGQTDPVADAKRPARRRLRDEGLHAARPYVSRSTILPFSSSGAHSTKP